MTLSYSIKLNDIGLFCHTIREIIVIFLPFTAKKPKYTRAMIKQLHIFDIKVSDL